MAGQGYGLPGTTQAPGASTIGNSTDAGTSAAYTGMSAMAPNNGASTSTNSATAAPGATAAAPPAPTPLGAPPGLLQADNSSSGFQLAAPQGNGTDIMGTPSWVDDWAKSGQPDLNTYYQQQHGYMDMTKPQATPAQLQFAPPPPPAAAAPAAAATPAAPAQAQGNWWAAKQGPAPAVTANTLFGSTPVDAATLDALPDAFVASQGFLNQYGSSPGAQAYQKWRMGPEAYFNAQSQQNAIRTASGAPPYYG